MGEPFRGLTGAAFTLVVGPNFDQLTVPSGILNKIPYFQAALNGDFVESVKKQFQFPNLDAKVVADIIFYCHSGVGKAEDRPVSSTCIRKTALDELKHRIKTYVLADAWGAEDVANALADQLVAYHQENMVHHELVTSLQEADLGEAPLYDFFLHQIASDCVSGFYGDLVECCAPGCGEKCPTRNLEPLNAVLSHTDLQKMLSIISEIQTKAEYKSLKLSDYQCAVHRHVYTEQCQFDQVMDGEGQQEIQGFWYKPWNRYEDN